MPTPTCPKCGTRLRLLRDYLTLVHPINDCADSPVSAPEGTPHE